MAIRSLVKSLIIRFLRVSRIKRGRNASNQTLPSGDLSSPTAEEKSVVKKDGEVDILRQTIGKRLYNYRTDKDLSIYRVAKDGQIRIEQVRSVEDGGNYSINTLLGYLSGCNLQMTFQDQEKRINRKKFGSIKKDV